MARSFAAWATVPDLAFQHGKEIAGRAGRIRLLVVLLALFSLAHVTHMLFLFSLAPTGPTRVRVALGPGGHALDVRAPLQCGNPHI
jgi:hypothetical protein